MLSLERLKGIEAFVATADAGSFTAAAARLNLTNSAVGKTVARLEARLKCRLFERTTRRLSLTDAGAAFHRVCVRMLTELEAAEQVLAAERVEVSGRLRIDVPATFGRLKVMSLLLAFAAEHPAVRPCITLTDRFVDVVDEGIDVAVRIGGSMPASPSPSLLPGSTDPVGPLAHRLLGHERLIFCASPAYLARRGAPVSPDDLDRHDAVTYGRADGSASPWLIAHPDGDVERRTTDGRMVVGHGEALVESVVAGFGIAQLATWLVHDPLADGRLVEFMPAFATTGLPLHLVWPRSRQLLPKVDRLLKHLGDTLSIA